MLNQVQSQKQQHTILPQQIELLNLFHLNTLQLEQRIMDELSENPLLEDQPIQEGSEADKYSKDQVQDFQNWEEYGYDDIPDYKTEYKNYLSTEQVPEKPLAETPDFREELKKQCRWLSIPEEQYFLLDFLIDSFNEGGFLDQDTEELASQLSFKLNCWVETVELDSALDKIRELEPAGTGCRCITDYLLFQLHRMDTRRPDVRSAICILQEHAQDLRSRNLEKIRRQLGLDEEEIRIVLQLLGHLRTRPVDPPPDKLRINNILPDFLIAEEDGAVDISLYRQRSSTLHISRTWTEMVQDASENKAVDKSTRQYLRNKLNSAQWFINAIRQRESNMLKIMQTIVSLQTEYFQYGDIRLLKPMKLKDIAEKVQVDISTVSRLTCNKYAATSFGTILLKDLFTEGIPNKEGDHISNRVIQSMIGELVGQENKKAPYTDRQLVTMLADRGYNVARRTVAKYRELLHIPVAQIRSIWN